MSSIEKSMKKQFSQYRNELAILAGVAFFLFFFLADPLSLAFKARLVLAVAILMISWWVLEALPLSVVALVPIVLFPLFNISPVKEVTKSYADSMIFLFMGGFFIALAIEKWKLHQRIALSIIHLTGTNGDRIILGFIMSTGFLSFWLSNTATTMMMFPIALSVIQVMNEHSKPGEHMKNFSTVLMLCIAYASNFAFGTIIATPPNVAYVGYIQEKFNYTIGFADWMMVFMPLSIIMMGCLYFVTVKWLFPNHIRHSEEGKKHISQTLKQLGPLSVAEKRVLAIFIGTVLLWITKDILNSLQSMVKLDDTMIAMTGGLLMFMVTSGKINDEGRAERILHWKDTTRMSWGILILFGGGIALAKALEEAQLMNQLGTFIASYATENLFVMILLITTISVFLSEVMSNVAQVIVMAPVISSVAIALHMDPLQLGLPMTIGATCAGMLPMGTPPNAIVFSSGYIKLNDMLKTGFVMNLISIILVSLFCYFLQPMIMKLT